MNFVRVSGSIGLSTLWISIISYFLSFILYLLSFTLPEWVHYTSVPIKVGLWRLCDIEMVGYDRCADWGDRTYPSNVTNTAFVGPPDFVRISQSLEIVAFVFYVIAGILLLVGLCQRSMGILFFGASMSMFVTVIFVSATVGLFAGKGKSQYVGYLSFAWWLAFVSLLISLVCSVSLTVLSFFIAPIPNMVTQNKIIEPNGKMFYSTPPYSNNAYAGQDMNNDFFQ